MLDVTPAPPPPCPLLRFLQRRLRGRRPGRRWLVLVALRLGACVAVAQPAPARGASLDALDPVGSSAWRGLLLPTALDAPAAPPVRERAPWLGLGGGIRSSPGERRHFFASIELGIPLDGLAGAAELASAPADADDADEPASDEPSAAAGAASPFDAPAMSSDGVPSAGAGGSQARPHALDPAPFVSAGGVTHGAGAPGSSPGRTAPLAALASYGPLDGAPLPPGLPGCGAARSCDPAALMLLARAAVSEALRVRGGQAELRRLDSMARRSRAAASLPEVRLGAGTSRDESLRLAPTAADPARFTRDGGRDLWLEARLTWRLDSAIFARDEIAIMRLRTQQREELARLASEVLEALVAFERARLRLASELSSSDERDQARVVQFGALARLDVLTDGWFSRRLERAASRGRGRDDAGPPTPAEGGP